MIKKMKLHKGFAARIKEIWNEESAREVSEVK